MANETPKQCVRLAENKQRCTCPSTSCRRHGVCCECVAYHRAQGDRPMCMR